jgi:hypothetical protein
LARVLIVKVMVWADKDSLWLEVGQMERVLKKNRIFSWQYLLKLKVQTKI